MNNQTSQKESFDVRASRGYSLPTKDPKGPSLDVDFDTDFNFLQIAMLGPRKNETKCSLFV